MIEGDCYLIFIVTVVLALFLPVLSQLIKFERHPFRLLLHLEWLLLGVTTTMLGGTFLNIRAFNAWSWYQLSLAEVPLLVVAIVLFGAMGLRLPITTQGKRIYTGLELFFWGIAAYLLDGDIHIITPLLIIIVIRSCLIFQKRGRWIIICGMALIYVVSRLPILILLWIVAHFGQQQWVKNLINSHLVNLPKDSFKFLPDGGVKIDVEFSSQQVNDFFAGMKPYSVNDLISGSFLFLLTLIFVLIVVNSLISERQGRRRLALAHEQLYQYSLQIEDQATLQERNRIAREIHDSLGHILTAQSVQLDNGLALIISDLEEAKKFFVDGKRLNQNALQELRYAIKMLRYDILKDKTFEEAIANLIADFQIITGFPPECEINLNTTLPYRIQVAIYRILEEALTNIYKHSGATAVTIKINIQSEPSNPDKLELILEIQDNGMGFDITQNASGFGLQGMEERAGYLGGRLQITSSYQSGCSILVCFPL